MTGKKLAEYRQQLVGKDAAAVLAWSLDEFGPQKVALASSFSTEDQVLSHMLSRSASPPASLPLIRAGSFRKPTTSCSAPWINSVSATRSARPLLKILPFCLPTQDQCHVPEPGQAGGLLRRRNCDLWKILQTVDAWICGLRRDQALTRKTWTSSSGISSRAI